MSDIRLMQGNEACALGALHAGVRFYAGYPITPSTEIAEIMAEELPKYGGKFIQMEDEIAGMAAIIGASLTGTKTLTATSGPGFSLKQENIGYAAMAEVPCVIVNVQRGGPSTGLPTSPAQGESYQSKYGSHGDRGAIVLTPSSVPECFKLAVDAVNLSEKYMTPVILLMDEIVGHMREAIDLEEQRKATVYDRKKPDCAPEDYVAYAPDENGAPVLAPFGSGYRYHVTGLTHDETVFPPWCRKKWKKSTGASSIKWKIIPKTSSSGKKLPPKTPKASSWLTAARPVPPWKPWKSSAPKAKKSVSSVPFPSGPSPKTL